MQALLNCAQSVVLSSDVTERYTRLSKGGVEEPVSGELPLIGTERLDELLPARQTRLLARTEWDWQRVAATLRSLARPCGSKESSLGRLARSPALNPSDWLEAEGGRKNGGWRKLKSSGASPRRALTPTLAPGPEALGEGRIDRVRAHAVVPFGFDRGEVAVFAVDAADGAKLWAGRAPFWGARSVAVRRIPFCGVRG